MATTLQTINLGNYANDGTGDDLRTAFQKVNSNFAALNYEVTGAINLGTGVGLFSNLDNATLRFKTLTSANHSVAFIESDNSIDLQAVSRLSSEPSPTLGGNLDLAGHKIIDTNSSTGIESKIYNIDIQALNAVISIIINSGANVDLGTFNNPTGYVSSTIRKSGYTLDMGNWTVGPNLPENNIDFGTF